MFNKQTYINYLKSKVGRVKISTLTELKARKKAEIENEEWGKDMFYYENRGYMQALWLVYNKLKEEIK